jgi:GDP-D-mannose 3',5'-epimerase
MKILVTGGAGLIGSNLSKRLLQNKYDISIVDNLWRGKKENLLFNDNIFFDLEKNFFELDLQHYQNCLNVTKNVDLVIHLADVVAGINYVFSNEYELFNKNIIINSNILKASIKNNVKNYIYVGTACSYPLELQKGINFKPLTEKDAYPANPESSYGWSKLMGEYEAELAQKEKLINVGILRLHNVYGPPCEISAEKSQVIPSLCRKILTEKNLIVWGSGQQRRSLVYVDDVVDGILAIMHKGMNKGVIQIGSPESYKISIIANKLVEISQKKIEIIYDKSKPEGDFDRRPNLEKAKKILKWKQKVSIEDGLIKTFDWIKTKIQK